MQIQVRFLNRKQSCLPSIFIPHNSCNLNSHYAQASHLLTFLLREQAKGFICYVDLFRSTIPQQNSVKPFVVRE